MLQNDKYFYNFSDEDFEWKLDGKPYTFKVGSVTPMTQSEFDHFAKHLVDRELGRANFRTNDQLRRAEFVAKCEAPAPEQNIATAPAPQIPSVQVETATVQSVENQPVPEFEGLKEEKPAETPKSWCDSCDAKGPIKHKKDCPKSKK